ncbi:MAG: DUF1232 domain-containing protein [Tannerellaceae bacterium]|jgi:uncharacterized membrane protein YkvA (DUF1232 family)|nr:DUF1232 domain-containing protein [Tannerellaceae bacterium]
MIGKFKARIKALKDDLSALYLAYKRKDVLIVAKIIIMIAVAYALSPIDLIPDLIPVLGYLDDLLILPLFAFIAIKLIPKQTMNECREQARDLWKDGKPEKWYYAIPIILIWLLILLVVIKKISEG